MKAKVIISSLLIILFIGGAIVLVWKNKPSPIQMQQPSMPSHMQMGSTHGSPTLAKNAVSIRDFGFSPATLTVKVGDKVTWTNQDAVGHSATADDNSFDTGILQQGQSGSTSFTKAGTYTYHCSVHPSMRATIIVQ